MNKRNKTILNICYVTIYLLVFIVLIIILDNITSNAKEPVKTSYRTYTVQQGDNLTKIANKYYTDTYLPEAIFEIKKENNLKTCDLKIGQVLKVRGE